MSDLGDPLAGETVAHVFVLREQLGEKIPVPVDIYAHESLLVRSLSGKHRIYERWADGPDYSDVPSPVSGKNTQASTTLLGKKKQTYKVNGRTFAKQIHGQKVEKAITFGDLNSFSANQRRFHEDYNFASNNCQDFQEQLRSELLGLKVPVSRRTAITKKLVKMIASPQTKDHVRTRSSGSLSAASDYLIKTSNSYGDHGIDLDNPTHPFDLHKPTLPFDLPSNHGNPYQRTLSTMFPERQALDSKRMIDDSLPSLFTEDPTLLSSCSASSPSSSFAQAQAQSSEEAEREGCRAAHQFQTHAPGLLGAAENAVNCFCGGEYFLGVWNTAALVWSCSMLYGTGGAVSITVQVPPDQSGPPKLQLAIAGLLML